MCCWVSAMRKRMVSSTCWVCLMRVNIFCSQSFPASSKPRSLSSRMASISEINLERSACTAATIAFSFLNFSLLESSSISMSSEHVSRLQAEKCMLMAATCALVCSMSHRSVSSVDAHTRTSSLVYE